MNVYDDASGSCCGTKVRGFRLIFSISPPRGLALDSAEGRRILDGMKDGLVRTPGSRSSGSGPRLQCGSVLMVPPAGRLTGPMNAAMVKTINAILYAFGIFTSRVRYVLAKR